MAHAISTIREAASQVAKYSGNVASCHTALRMCDEALATLQQLYTGNPTEDRRIDAVAMMAKNGKAAAQQVSLPGLEPNSKRRQ